jgi:predicted cupin superfamily sugar epimerase
MPDHLPDITAERLIEILDLAPLPWEGGYYRETWRSDVQVPQPALGADYDGPRAAGTSIYYMLTPDTVSKMHRLPSPETFHFYMGDRVEMLLLHAQISDTVVFGQDIMAGQKLQFTVPGMVWMGARLLPVAHDSDLPNHGFALMGTTVAPGFDFDDLEMGDGDSLAYAYPDHAPLIRALS